MLNTLLVFWLVFGPIWLFVLTFVVYRHEGYIEEWRWRGTPHEEGPE